jgi:hypothetical protein
MALSTNTILGSIEWAKRFSYNRPSGIGNSIEPAKTSAELVLQTILSPPFDWWWNALELSFTANPVAATYTPVGNITIASGTLTALVTTPLVPQQVVLLSDFTNITALNGQAVVVLNNASGTLTTTIQSVANQTTGDTGVVTLATTQDYIVSAPTFGDIEHVSVLDISKAPAKWTQMEVKENLALDSSPAGRPQFISAEYQDATGNVTFRLMPPPALAYPVSLHVQQVAPLVTSLNQTWAPLPDYFAYIYNWGFLSLMWSFADDSRAPMASQKFVANLLGRAEGLSETDRNIFLNNWTALTGAQVSEQQQGIQARGAL